MSTKNTHKKRVIYNMPNFLLPNQISKSPVLFMNGIPPVHLAQRKKTKKGGGRVREKREEEVRGLDIFWRKKGRGSEKGMSEKGGRRMETWRRWRWLECSRPCSCEKYTDNSGHKTDMQR